MTGSTLAFLAMVGTALAQAPAIPPAAPPLERMVFVVEFADGRVIHSPVGPRKGIAWTPMFPRVRGWQPTPGHPPAAALKRTVERMDGGVRYTVSVLLGDAHEREVAVHEGTLLMGERVTVNGLVEYGIRPVVVALEPLASVGFHEPAIINGPAGLQIIAIRTIIDPAPRYVVEVENVTDRGADGFSFESRVGGHTAQSAHEGNEDGRVLVPARGTYTFDFPFPTGPGRAREPWAPIPADELAITSVSWDDGSFEGEPREAGVHRIRLMARRIQVERVVRALRLASADIDLARAVSRLRRDVDSLSIEVDTALERTGMTLVPAPGMMPAADVTGLIRSTLQRVKSQAAGEVASIERAPDLAAARRSLQTMDQEFNTWLRQLQR